MRQPPSHAVMLAGTDQEVEPPRLLTAGKLTAELEAGNLRYIRYDGIEMIRAVSFIVRDKNWGTYNPEISSLEVAEDGERFTVTYDAVTRDAKQQFRYSAVITGSSAGKLDFTAKGEAVTDFLTARTGFVVLHPIDGVAGAPARIATVDGEVSDTRFPELIDPVQPMMNLRAITHSFAPGATVECRMEGDTFEMEDQRNWTDASYKTYVRPLALPWPYTLAKGTTVEQAVRLKIEGRPAAKTGARSSVSVRIGEEVGPVPALGAGLAPEDITGVKDNRAVLAKLGLSYLVCHHDARKGHDAASLADAAATANELGSTPWLEAVIGGVENYEEEIARLAAAASKLGNPFPVVLLSPAPDLKCVLPGSPWPPCPPAREFFETARRHFPKARIGGGMFSFFTELNRKRPPLDRLDFVSFTTSALVHAGDDRSVTEGLEALPHIARSVRSFIAGKPYAVGPSAIAMRDNPYGAAVADNPEDIRQAMNRNDPRQRSLLGAAWNLAYFAHFAYGGAAAIALGGLAGPFGVVHSRADWPQAWYDEGGGLYPAYHILRGLGALGRATLRQTEITAPRHVQALAARNGDATTLWLANLTAEPQRVALEGIAGGRIARLNSQSFMQAAEDPDALTKPSDKRDSGAIELGPYEVVHIVA
jgi:D-apionolactonase